jgi:DNA-binding transcriptional LysR family regulator
VAEHDYIALAQGRGNRPLIDQGLARLPKRPRWFCEVQHVPALVSRVHAGISIGVVPGMALPPDGRKALAAIPVPDPRVTTDVGIDFETRTRTAGSGEAAL